MGTRFGKPLLFATVIAALAGWAGWAGAAEPAAAPGAATGAATGATAGTASAPIGQGGWGPGMMGGGGPCGMRGGGYGPMHGAMMGGGMMGGGMMMGWGGQIRDRHFTPDDVRKILEARLVWGGNRRLKVGAVKAKDANTIIADIDTVDNSLVERLEVDPRTGFMRPQR